MRDKRLPTLPPAGLLLLAVMTTASAQNFTVARFDDPSPNGAIPIFSLEGNIFSGAWHEPGLLLQTPGLPAPDIANAHFSMTPITVGAGGATTGGTITLLRSPMNPPLRNSL
jgi:hypothetical protein